MGTVEFDSKSMEKPHRKVQLIVAADEPALFFSSVAVAEKYLEPTDVEDKVYTSAYGPQGEPYRVGVEEKHVIIRRKDGEPSKPDELKALLLRYFATVGISTHPDETLANLLDRCRSRLTR